MYTRACAHTHPHTHTHTHIVTFTYPSWVHDNRKQLELYSLWKMGPKIVETDATNLMYWGMRAFTTCSKIRTPTGDKQRYIITAWKENILIDNGAFFLQPKNVTSIPLEARSQCHLELFRHTFAWILGIRVHSHCSILMRNYRKTEVSNLLHMCRIPDSSSLQTKKIHYNRHLLFSFPIIFSWMS